MTPEESRLHSILNSRDGIAALAYVQGTSDEQRYTLSGAGVAPFTRVDAVDVRSDLETGSGNQRGSWELYARLGKNAELLARFAVVLAEIAVAGAAVAGAAGAAAEDG